MSSFFTETEPQSEKKAFKPYYAVKDGQENIYRIAPACRSLATMAKPGYAVFKSIHFGYGIQDTFNPDKTRARPFECVARKDYKTKMMIESCAECTNIEKVQLQLEQLKVDLKSKGHPEDYIRQATTPQNDWLRNHNRDSKWYMYAKTMAGEWNVLKIGHKTKIALDALIDELKRDGIKALAPDTGVWFKFTKNGAKGLAALTTVQVVRERKDFGNGQKGDVIKDAPLTESDQAAIMALVDVTTSVTVITPLQVTALVASGGDPTVAATIFSLGRKMDAPNVANGTGTGITATGPVPSSMVGNTLGLGGFNAAALSTAVVPSQPVADVKPALQADEVAKMGPEAFLRSFQKNG